MPRLFIAIDLDDDARATLTALVDPALGGKWTPGEQLHLTVRFLGSVPAARVADTTTALTRVRAPRFALALSTLGVFPARPGRTPPAVLWAGVTPAAPVHALKAAIDAIIDAIVGPDPESAERGFTPHVTLARWREGPRSSLAGLLARPAALDGARFAVDHFSLYESRTLPTGSVYQRLASYALGGPTEPGGASGSDT